jgi:Ni,Fe-hydrogenase III large subunit
VLGRTRTARTAHRHFSRGSRRGGTLCVVEREAGRLVRVHLRTGSYANWPSVAFAAADNLLPDFPLINKSFELCYACADR